MSDSSPPEPVDARSDPGLRPQDASQLFELLRGEMHNEVDPDVARIICDSLFSEAKKPWRLALEEIQARIGTSE